MTLPSRPNVITSEDTNFQALISSANVVNQIGVNGFVAVAGANQAIALIPGMVQTATASALVSVNSAVAAAQAAQVTDKKFISSTTAQPTAPTGTDLTTYPGDIFGSRLDTNGAVQRTLWDRGSGLWRDNGQPGAIKADVDAAALVGTSALTGLNSSRAQLLSGTLNVGSAGRVLSDGGMLDVLPNTSAPSVDGQMVFQLANNQRAVRNISSTGFITSAQFNVPTDAVTDAAPALSAAISYAILKNLELRILPGTYVTLTELVINGTVNIRAAGNGFVPQVTIKAGAAMRSVCNIAGQFSHLKGIMFDANKLADYAVLERGSAYATFDNCGYENAVLDNLHRSATTNAGGTANNDGSEYKNCVWNNAGRVFGTAAMLSRAEYNRPEILGNQRVTVSGTVSVASGGTVLTGTGTAFLAARARRGDTVRLGDGWLDAQPTVLLEILSVDSNTQITLAEPCPATFTAQKYALHVGDNFHEEDALDNNVSRIYGGISRGAAGSAFLWAGAYGNTIIGAAMDYNMGWAVRVGRRQGAYYVFFANLYNPYFEGNYFGSINLGKSINFRMFGGQDGNPAGYGPLMRANPLAGETRGAQLFGVGDQALQVFGTMYPVTGSGFTLPRSSLPENGDLSSSAYWANKFPAGLSITAINGATNCPGTATLGVLETLIDPTYITDGGGFGYQKFIPAAGSDTTWVRYGSTIAANVAWAGWKPVTQQAPACADIAPAAGAAYSQGQVQAILDELRDLKNKLRSSGSRVLAP